MGNNYLNSIFCIKKFCLARQYAVENCLKYMELQMEMANWNGKWKWQMGMINGNGKWKWQIGMANWNGKWEWLM